MSLREGEAGAHVPDPSERDPDASGGSGGSGAPADSGGSAVPGGSGGSGGPGGPGGVVGPGSSAGSGGFGVGTLLRLVSGQQGSAARGRGPDGKPALPRFAEAAREALADAGARHDLAESAGLARDRLAAATGEPSDWEELRAAGAAIRDRALLDLGAHLEAFERAVTDAGGTVHWARTASDARRIVASLVREGGEVAVADGPVLREVRLADALAEQGISACDAGGPEGRDRVRAARVAVTGADFLVADSGTVVLLEADGAARACLTLAEKLVCVAGMDRAVPDWTDLEVLLQLLPRAAGGQRLSPQVSAWTGVVPGDGPSEVHVVLVDNGRTRILGDDVGREALRCIGCGACSAVCPVYERVGDHPYDPRGTGPSGPIGAVWTPLARGVDRAQTASLPFASTLCGACAEVCPVKIDIPGLLVHLRGEVVDARRNRPVPTPELAVMRGLAWTMADARRFEAAVGRGSRWARLVARGGRIRRLPGLLGRWTEARDLAAPPAESFRVWWRRREAARRRLR
ncbi:LUD domain-containing protein [Actinomadura oligospora]|uniref:LUD domain-containing protein n=1 Tax=Actinomadura oligospora TaxID=111804 RepID=UPI0004AF9E89|nr:LUD domain-containing protein [Actinomadura oligospora]